QPDTQRIAAGTVTASRRSAAADATKGTAARRKGVTTIGIGIARTAIGISAGAARAAFTASIYPALGRGRTAIGAAVLVEVGVIGDGRIAQIILIVHRRRLRNDDGVVVASTVQRIVQHVVDIDVIGPDADIAIAVDQQIAHGALHIAQVDVGIIIVGRFPAIKIKPHTDIGRDIGMDISVVIGRVHGLILGIVRCIIMGRVAGRIVGSIIGRILGDIARQVAGRIARHISSSIARHIARSIIRMRFGRAAVRIGVCIRVVVRVALALILPLALTLALTLVLTLILILGLLVQLTLSLALTLALSLALALTLTLTLLLILVLIVGRPGKEIHITATSHRRYLLSEAGEMRPDHSQARLPARFSVEKGKPIPIAGPAPTVTTARLFLTCC
ncbi:hypothetical protein, partial [Paracoccus sp. (in: a-proteobacteria)]|uniref:hypothetical protein n=1 Tax=Paracoccus sp. TaxID=267 RepID=UPI0028AB730D